jgi:taurine dioxygenase
MSEIQVAPLNPVVGAEILGVDLKKLDPVAVKEIREAWLAHGVVFFRDQELTLEQHKDVGRQFGGLHIHPNVPGPEGHPEILVLHADENSKRVGGNGWHTDVSCDPTPPSGSMLRLETVPPSGGDTLFASMYAAYAALSDHWQRFLSELQGVHESLHVHKGANPNKPDEDFARAVHPVVRTHPETGRKTLYVNSGFTTRIVGMKPAESRATLDFLFRHIQSPEFQCRFQWRANSIAFWDNRCVQHYATWDYFPHKRHGYRVTIAGDTPF